MVYILLCLIAYLVTGSVLQWKAYKKHQTLNILEYYNLTNPKWHLFWPLIGAICWPAIINYWKKTDK